MIIVDSDLKPKYNRPKRRKVYKYNKAVVAGVSEHGLHCKEKVTIEDFETFGHVQKLTLQCKENHTLKMDTSTRLPGGKFLVNLRVMHGIYASGLRYAQYERFARTAYFGAISETAFHEIQDMYCDVTETVAQESISDAVDEEVSTTMLESENVDDYKGITIVTDARHGWRKNSRFSDIISLGYRTKKVTGYAVVSHGDDPCSQRHELHGVKKLYEGFSDKGANVKSRDKLKLPNQSIFSNQIEQDRDNPKKLWKHLKDIGLKGKQKEDSAICLKILDEICHDSKMVANHFNNFFTTIAFTLVSKLPKCTN